MPSFYALDVARSITGHVPDYEVLARDAELAGASRLAWPAPRDPSRGNRRLPNMIWLRYGHSSIRTSRGRDDWPMS